MVREDPLNGQRVPSPIGMWERLMPMWHAVFYGILCLATVFALFERHADLQAFAVVVTVLGFGLWYWLLVLRVAHGWNRAHARVLLLYLVGALCFTAVLTTFHGVYLLVLCVLYPQVFGMLSSRFAIAGSVVLSLIVALLLTESTNMFALSAEAAVFGVFSLLFSLLFGLWINAIISQSRQRQQLIDELEATRHSLAVAEHEAGVLAERQRIAHEIHDTLAQGFISIVMHMEAADAQLALDEPVRQHLDQARDTAREGVAESRRLVQALRPPVLEQGSLHEALDRLAQRWPAAPTTNAVLVTGTPRPLTPDIEVTLFRAAQEALTNVHRHAQAQAVVVTLSYLDDRVILDVQDDGTGFAPAAPTLNGHHEGGYGLVAMRERVEQLGGTQTIESVVGEGTTIVVELAT